MAYVAFLKIVDTAKNQEARAAHLQYIGERYREGKVLMAGPFGDQSGGMVVYHNVTEEGARRLAESDPAVTSGARTLTLIPWAILDFDATSS